jgi:FMN-dependent NADH-azoreductase
MKTLVIYYLPREESRTKRLLNLFLNIGKFNDVDYLDLNNEDIKPLKLNDIVKRDNHIMNNDYNDPMFKYAKEFIKYENIIIACPFWDLSFPSIIKIYIENICVNNLTFKYVNDRPQGLSKFKNFYYLTTAGGPINESNSATIYLKEISEFLGNGKFHSFYIDKLDIEGMDIIKLFKEKEEEIKKYFN